MRLFSTIFTPAHSIPQQHFPAADCPQECSRHWHSLRSLFPLFPSAQYPIIVPGFAWLSFALAANIFAGQHSIPFPPLCSGPISVICLPCSRPWPFPAAHWFPELQSSGKSPPMTMAAPRICKKKIMQNCMPSGRAFGCCTFFLYFCRPPSRCCANIFARHYKKCQLASGTANAIACLLITHHHASFGARNRQRIVDELCCCWLLLIRRCRSQEERNVLVLLT